MAKRKRVADEPGGAAAGPQEKHKRKKTARPEKAISCFEKHVETVWRALKKSRGFERQRLYKRIAEQTKKSKKQAKGKVPSREKRKPKAGHLNGISSTATDGVDHREQADARIARFEREIQVLRTLDLLITARVHLARVLLRHRVLADAHGPLTAHLHKSTEAKSTRKPTASSDDGASDDGSDDAGAEEELDEAARKQRADDIHNITSALNNRPFVKQAVEKATQEICGLLGVETPGQVAKAERRLKANPAKEDDKKAEEEEEPADADGDAEEDIRDTDIIVSDGEDDKAGAPNDTVHGLSKKETSKSEKKPASVQDNSDDEDDELERELAQDMAKYDAMLGGSSDEDSDDDKDDSKDASRARYLSLLSTAGAKKTDEADEDEADEDEDEDEDEQDAESESELGNSDSGSGSGSDSDSAGGIDIDSDAEESSEDEALRPPRKRAATAATKATKAGKTGKADKAAPGTSHFLPTLMGGYISDGADSDDEGGRAFSGDDEDHEAVAARLLGGPRKNRRGQRARQAIWEKKYKQEARHLREAEKKKQQKQDKKGGSGSSKKDGWDAKRGAVDASDAPRWLRRKMGNFSKKADGRADGAAAAASSTLPNRESAPAGGAGAKARDDTGSLHPSWEAAKKAKEKAQTAPFEGKKIVFE